MLPKNKYALPNRIILTGTRIIVTGILAVLTCLASGCLFPAEHAAPAVSPTPSFSGESQVQYGGTAVAVAFDRNGLTSSSPEAKEQFLKGLTLLTHYGRYNESLRYFDAALALDQNFTEVRVAEGVAFHNLKRYDEAIRSYDRALALSPGDADTWHLEGVTYADYGQPERAAECNRRAAELDPRYGVP